MSSGFVFGASAQCPASMSGYQIVLDMDNLPGDYQPSIIREPELDVLTVLASGCTAAGCIR